MDVLTQKLRSSPFVSRVAPFIIFAGLTSCQGLFGEAGRYWIYLAKSVVGAWLLFGVWPVVKELRWTVSIEAVLVGVGVIVVWVALDRFYPKLVKEGTPWNPHAQFGSGTSLAWFFVVARILGSSLIVPGMEEMFYRSFLYRWIIRPNFEEISLKQFHLISFLVTSAIFGVVHREWLAGILCGMAYQWLVLRKGHLGDAVTAHAISNLTLGLWVVYKEAWQFW